MSRLLIVCVCASVVTALNSAPAWAGSQTQVQNQAFQFDLNRASIDDVAFPFDPTQYDAIWVGNTTRPFQLFNPGLGTLEKVKIETEININGQIQIFRTDITATNTQVNTPNPPSVFDNLKVHAVGKTTIGPLNAPFDFGEYNVGEDGVIFDDFLQLDIDGTGMDMTTMPAGLAQFIGIGNIDAYIAACLMLKYEENQFGGSETLNAQGEAKLTYTFDKGGPTVIPSPVALPAGLLLLSGLMLHRRRAG